MSAHYEIVFYFCFRRPRVVRNQKNFVRYQCWSLYFPPLVRCYLWTAIETGWNYFVFL